MNDEVRFQNGAMWAGIPEEEVPKPLIRLNSDGKTYRFAPEAITENIYGRSGVDLVGINKKIIGLGNQKVIDAAKKKGIIKDRDFFSTVGGLHSDYSVIEENPQAVLWQFFDEQKLNPQWMVASLLKLPLNKKSNLWKKLHIWGGKDWGQKILGYTPFTYKQGIDVYKDFTNNKQIIYFDPTYYKRTGRFIE